MMPGSEEVSIYHNDPELTTIRFKPSSPPKPYSDPKISSRSKNPKISQNQLFSTKSTLFLSNPLSRIPKPHWTPSSLLPKTSAQLIAQTSPNPARTPLPDLRLPKKLQNSSQDQLPDATQRLLEIPQQEHSAQAAPGDRNQQNQGVQLYQWYLWKILCAKGGHNCGRQTSSLSGPEDQV